MRFRDHPREYGENWEPVDTGAMEAGSSPRIRGKSGLTRWLQAQFGIIPANTGKMRTFRELM